MQTRPGSQALVAFLLCDERHVHLAGAACASARIWQLRAPVTNQKEDQAADGGEGASGVRPQTEPDHGSNSP